MLFKPVFLFVLISVVSLRASFSFEDYGGLGNSEQFKIYKEIYGHFSPITGKKVLDFVKNQRFYGRYGSKDELYTCHGQITKYDTDWPHAAVEQFIQHMFPSPDRVNFVANQWLDKDIISKFTPRVVGAILNQIKDYSTKGIKQEEQEKLAFAIYRILNPKTYTNYTNKYENRCNKAKEGSNSPLTEEKKERLFKRLVVQKIKRTHDYKEIQGYTDMLIDALKGANDDPAHYPPNIVENTLLAFAWKKGTRKEHFIEMMSEMQDMMEDGADFNSIKQKILETKYTKADFEGLSKQIKKSPEDTIAAILSDDVWSAYLKSAIHAYEDILPEAITYSQATIVDPKDKQKRLSFSDCGETAVQNLFNVFLFNPKSHSFDTETLERIQKKTKQNVDSRLQQFYNDFKAPGTLRTQDRRNAWAEVYSNREGIKYRKKGGCEAVSSLNNHLNVIAQLLNDVQLRKPAGKNENEKSKAQLNRLVTLFSDASEDGVKWSWKVKGKQEITKNTGIIIDFFKDDKPIAWWEIKPGHAVTRIKTAKNDQSTSTYISEYLKDRLDEIPGDSLNHIIFMDKALLESYLSQYKGGNYNIMGYGNLESSESKVNRLATMSDSKIYQGKNILPRLVKSVALNDKYTMLKLHNILISWKSAPASVSETRQNIEAMISSDPKKYTFLAASEGSLATVQYIVDNTSYLKQNDFKDNEGETPLHIAAEEDRLDMVKYLVDNVPNLLKEEHLKSDDGNTPLHLAAQYGNLDVVQYLVTDEKTQALLEEENLKNNEGETPLHLAASTGVLKPDKKPGLVDRLAVVQYLVEKVKALLEEENLKNNGGETPLHLAALNGNLDVVQYLVEKVKVLLTEENLKDNDRDTPLHLAAQYGILDVVQYLVTNEKAQALLEEENLKNNEGKTPLHLAASTGVLKPDKKLGLVDRLAVVKHLVEKVPGLVNIKSAYGETPLHIAAEEGRLDMVEYLVEKVPDLVITKNNGGETPLHAAIGRGKLNVVEYLVGKVPNLVNIKDQYGNTPLHIAIVHGHLDVVKHLVEKVPDLVNIKSAYGHTPLHTAEQNGNNDIVKYLTQKMQDLSNGN